MIRIQLRKSLTTSNGSMNLDVDFSFVDNELVTLFGPSGSGKTTILRMIAGLTEPEEGVIQVGHEIWFDRSKNINRPVQKREIGFVFQDYTLFPNMTIRENVEYALPNKKDKSFIDELFTLIDLKKMGHLKPAFLSGGQKQRVAFIRALARKPKILLLDEPFSALDISMRLKMQDEIINICERFSVTTIFVSHDIAEVFKLSHRVLVLEDGKIARSGLPHDVFGADKMSDDFKFVGEVVGLNEIQSGLELTVKVGSYLGKMYTNEKNYRLGDRVMVVTNTAHATIQKI
jgi:molybdate transport system ATP-binding protein